MAPARAGVGMTAHSDVAAGTPARTPPLADRLASALAPAVAVLALLAAWQLLAVLADDAVSWPAPAAVLGRFVDRWLAEPAAWTESVAPSVARLLGGWLGAAVIGIGVGVLIGRSVRAGDLLGPAIGFLRAIPPPALLPLFLVVLGIGDEMKVALIAFGAVWPVLLNTADGVASVEPLHLDTARAYRLGATTTLWRIVLPSAAPRIFAGLRISLSIAVILMVISEMVATVNGIGFELVQAQRTFRSLDVWATVVLLGVLGAVLNAGLGLVERRVLATPATAHGVRR